MIGSLHNIHEGSTISVVASGPSASMYDGRGDISIGVNGSALLGTVFDYFICGDPRSSDCDWFHINCSRVRVIARAIASVDYQLYPEHIYKFERFAATTCETSEQKRKLIRQLPEPVYPHKTFRYSWYAEDKLKLNSMLLLYGGTISCCAMQLAWMMGSRHIVLFGCDFTHESGNYFYPANKIGKIWRSQVETMQNAIDALRSKNVTIDIVGKSMLK